MKYSIIFAATAAASYDAYASKPADYAKPTPAKPTCYGTVTPGYGKTPVEITSQYQPYPTCVSKGYDGKSCDKWGEEAYVSTTIKDYNGKDVCVTKTDYPVTVYYEKKTITHTETGKYGAYATPVGGYPSKPTGAEYKIDNKGCWYEINEKIETVPYGKLGANALKGYPGSGLCKDNDYNQEVSVKEYKNAKWSEYKSTHAYGAPTPYITSYPSTGVYTVPSQDKTIYSTVPYCAETTAKAKAGETCTYGGQWMDVKKTGYVTGAYGAYETGVYNGKPTTSKVIKYTTIYVTSTGKVEVCKPTTTVYAKDTTYAYPTASYYAPGVYHYDAKTVTVTKANEPYTCEYKQTKVYETSTKYEDSYGYKPSPTPYKPTMGDSKYPLYPVKGNETNAYGGYASGTGVKPYYAAATSTPCDEEKKGYPTGTAPKYPVKDDKYPAKKPEGYYPAASSTPCDEDIKKSYPTGMPPKYPTKPEGYYPASSAVEYYPASSAAAYYPASSAAGYYPASAAYYPASSAPAEYYPASTPVYPAYAASTPCDEEVKKGYPTATPYPATYPKRDSLAERRKRAL